MKLISMTDFVLEQSKLTGYDISDYDWIIRVVNYARFLKQPLKLEMFVSDDKEKVLFEGFVYTDSQKYSYLNRIPLSVSPYGLKNERLQLTKLKEDNKFHTWLQLYTIEDLIKCDLELTQNATKQFL